jgi:hypothetical protein
MRPAPRRTLCSALPTPITNTFPPNCAAKIPACTLLSTPVHSSTTRTPAGVSAAVRTFAAIAFGLSPRSTSTVRTPGTSSFANASREGTMSEITIGSAPAARAESRDTSPIGPAPLCGARASQLGAAERARGARNARDEGRVAEPELRALDARERDGERLAERALLERDGRRELVQPRGGVQVPAGERAVVRGRGEEDDVRARCCA